MKNANRILAVVVCLGILLSGCNRTSPNQSPDTLPYTFAKDWPQLADQKLGQVTGIGVDTSQHIFIFHRATRKWVSRSLPFPDTLIMANTILELDNETGKILNAWGGNQFIMPHGLTVDQDNNIWVTDVGLHQIFKFTHDGKLLMTLGIAKTAGADSLHFNLPTDVAVAEDGSFYVSDGYGNSRVIRFSSEGKYLFEWGVKGEKPGEFNIPHAVDLDRHGNVYVADRENSRIQKFDGQGKFLREWHDPSMAKLYALTVNRQNQDLLAVDFLFEQDSIVKGSDIIRIDSTGNIRLKFGRSGFYDGPLSMYHDVAVDRNGNIYAADIYKNSIQKFTKQ